MASNMIKRLEADLLLSQHQTLERIKELFAINSNNPDEIVQKIASEITRRDRIIENYEFGIADAIDWSKVQKKS